MLLAVGALDVCTEIERVIELISDERTEMERKKNKKPLASTGGRGVVGCAGGGVTGLPWVGKMCAQKRS